MDRTRYPDPLRTGLENRPGFLPGATFAYSSLKLSP